MKKLSLFAVVVSFVIVIGFRVAGAQQRGAPDPNAPAGGTIIRLDPALDELIAPDAKFEVVSDTFTSAEGPAWVPQGKSGFLLFSDVNTNKIVKFEPGCDKYPCPIESGKISVFAEHSGYTQAELDAGKVSLPDHAGTVGVAVDPQGRILSANYGEHGVVRYEKDGTHTILANTFEGKKFTCPNKLVIKSNGAIYFTDPVTTCIKGGDQSPEREMDYHGLFLVKDGKASLLAKDPQGGAPHGIAMSPDEKVLYIGAGRKILAYDIKEDDSLANERVFLDMTNEKGGVDGITADAKGNLWMAGPGGMWIVTPEGKHLGTIAVPAVQGVRFANCAFGDPDRKTLYITGNKNLWRIRVKVPGFTTKAAKKS